MKFLIDECLSPALVKVARDRGYGESSHVVWLGRSSTEDWNLARTIFNHDWTFVTRNAVDFRGRKGRPGLPGIHARAEIHAGLVCLDAPEPFTRAEQVALFEVALRHVHGESDLVNEVLEVSALAGGQIHVVRYTMPTDR